MFAAGLSLIFGVMRLVNIAHGDLIVLAAFVALVVTQGLGLHPLLSLLVVVPAMAAVGYGLQRGQLNRTLGGDILPPLLVTFGLSIVIQNALAVVAIAGVFLAIRTNFDPTIGPGRLIYAFEAVIIGGLGSLWGTLAGGVLLGVAQSIGAKIDPGWQILAGHLAFLLVL